MTHVLGVDGGNTKTIALIARTDGTIIGWGRGGCSDIYGAGSPEAAFVELDSAVNAALEGAGIQPRELASAAFSMAGADWPEDFDLIREALQTRGYGQRRLVVNDALGALRAGSPDGTGVAVVCGTGATTGARAPDGRFWHSSWWQEPQGSRHLAGIALWAVYEAELGIRPSTSLRARALEIFQADTVEEVLHLHTRRAARRPGKYGAVTVALLEEADAGDELARHIVCRHGRALGDHALAAARIVGITDLPFTLVLAGGVLRHPNRLLPDAIVARVREEAPDVQPVMSVFEPAVGALLLALEESGVRIDPAIIRALERSLPPPELFHT